MSSPLIAVLTPVPYRARGTGFATDALSRGGRLLAFLTAAERAEEGHKISQGLRRVSC